MFFIIKGSGKSAKIQTGKTKQLESVGGLCSLQHILKCQDTEFVVITLFYKHISGWEGSGGKRKVANVIY